MADFTVSEESSKTFVRESPDKAENILKGTNWESATYTVDQVGRTLILDQIASSTQIQCSKARKKGNWKLILG